MEGYQARWMLSESHEVLLSYIRFSTLEENLKAKTKKGQRSLDTVCILPRPSVKGDMVQDHNARLEANVNNRVIRGRLLYQ